jgi:hypothetical protein
MRRITIDIVLLALAVLGGIGCRVEAPSPSPHTPTTTADSDEGDRSPAVMNSTQLQEAAVDTAVAEPQDTSPDGDTTPPTVAAPADDRQIVPITFDDLKLDMTEDMVFSPTLLTERVKQLDGRRVRIRGFLFPSVFQQTGITSFPLIKNLECKFGPGGQAHHIVIVEMKPGQSTSFTVRPIAVEGVLSVRPWNGPDGNTWALYHMVGEKVE